MAPDKRFCAIELRRHCLVTLCRADGPPDRRAEEVAGGGDQERAAVRLSDPRATDEDAEALSGAVRGLKASLRLCSICNNVTDIDPCAYCASATRNQRLVCVVEEATSIEAVERTRGFQGVYHVLHGTLSPLHGVGPEQLRAGTLVARVERGEVDEVILATSPTLEGEATANWLASALRGFKVRITRIATGVPAGSDIEYADEVTMARAMEGRREV